MYVKDRQFNFNILYACRSQASESHNPRVTIQIECILQGTAGQEAEAGMEMSALVNYVQPVHFHSFEHAESKYRLYGQQNAIVKEFHKLTCSH